MFEVRATEAELADARADERKTQSALEGQVDRRAASPAEPFWDQISPRESMNQASFGFQKGEMKTTHPRGSERACSPLQ